MLGFASSYILYPLPPSPRSEIARLYELLDERDATMREMLEENERTKAAYAERIAEAESRTSPCDLQSGICVHAAEAMQLRDEVARLQKKLDGRVRHYENATTPGRHGYNEARASVRAEEERMHAAEEGREVVENHTIGPPLGHAGQQSEIEPMRIVLYENHVALWLDCQPLISASIHLEFCLLV